MIFPCGSRTHRALDHTPLCSKRPHEIHDPASANLSMSTWSRDGEFVRRYCKLECVRFKRLLAALIGCLR
jgi:hypothetical protein